MRKGLRRPVRFRERLSIHGLASKCVGLVGKSLVLATVVLGLSRATTGSIQYVEYFKGVVHRPQQLREGQKVEPGQLISTGIRSRVVLSYSGNAPGGRPCDGWVIIPSEQDYLVPETVLDPECPPRGSPDDLDADKAVSVVVFYGPPGGNRDRPSRRPVDPAEAVNIYQLKKTFEARLQALPRSLVGILSAVEREGVTVTSDTNMERRMTIDTQSPNIPYEELRDLRGKHVFAEYISETVFPPASRSPNAALGVLVSIMPTHSDKFFEMMGFSEQGADSAPCDSPLGALSCLEFTDGYRWVVPDQIQSPLTTEARYGVAIESVDGTQARYQHILDTRFVRTESRKE